MAATKKLLAKKELALDGALKTYEDPTKIKPNDFQTLTNLRYRRGGVKAVGGMSAITSNAIGATVDNLFHFRKSYPGAETHVLASGVTASLSNVYAYTTTIPSAGDFGATMYTGGGQGQGRFSATPNGGVAFCNGSDTALWYGTWYPPSQFIDWDKVGRTYKYNYTEQVNNSQSGTNQLATIHSHADTLDANDYAIYSLDNALTDEVSSLTLANGGSVTFSNTSNINSNFANEGAGYYAEFDGNNSAVLYRAGSDFASVNSGDWSAECWVKLDNTTSKYVFGFYADGNNAGFLYGNKYTASDGSIWYRFSWSVKVGGVTKITLHSGYRRVTDSNGWFHVGVCGTTTGYHYLYAGGLLASSGLATGSSVVPDPTGGYMGIGALWGGASWSNAMTGWIDEFRFSTTRRYTAASYGLPVWPFGDGGNVVEMYVGALMPLNGIYFDLVDKNNSETSTSTVYYWDGSDWADTGATDATVTSGRSLAKDGAFTFTGHANHKATVLDDLFLYWYKIVIKGITSGSYTVQEIKVNSPMYAIQELWDGDYRPPAGFHRYVSSSTEFIDHTTAIFEDWFDSANTATYADLNGVAAFDQSAGTGDYLLVGSLERLAGINIGVAGGYNNQATSGMTVAYWDGSAWQNMAVQDGTSSAGITLSNSGTVVWETIAPIKEFTQNVGVIASSALQKKVDAVSGQTVIDRSQETVSEGGENSLFGRKPKLPGRVWSAVKSVNPDAPSSAVDLYYYRITFSTALSNSEGVWLYAIKGIPAQNEIRGYTFPLLHDDRLWLCGNTDSDPSSAVYSAPFRPQVFNGEECGKIWFGDNRIVKGGVSFSNQFAASTQKMAMFFKDNETWKVLGEFPYTVHQVSDTDGLVAPLTLAVSEMEQAAGFKRKVAVWLSQRGVVISDGNTITDISMDVKDLFEPTHANYLGASNLAAARGFVDSTRNEYHLVIPSSSEWVFSFDHQKWYQIDRGTYKLKGGAVVVGTNGASYTYGWTSGNKVYYLENGTQNVDEAITCTLRTADLALDQNYVTEETVVRGVKVIQRAKESLGTNMSVKHYGDSSTTATTLTAINPSKSGYRLDDTARMYRLGPHIFHSFWLQLSSSAETIPMFEPEFISILFERAREDVRA